MLGTQSPEDEVGLASQQEGCPHKDGCMRRPLQPGWTLGAARHYLGSHHLSG